MSEKGILMKKDKEISRTEKLAQKTDNFLSSNRKLLIIILVVIAYVGALVMSIHHKITGTKED